VAFGWAATLTVDKKYLSMDIRVCNKEIRVEGRIVRIGRLDGSGFRFLDNRETVIEAQQRFRCFPLRFADAGER